MQFSTVVSRRSVLVIATSHRIIRCGERS
jgi:hypothetical protein